jgi:hypothetical protein
LIDLRKLKAINMKTMNKYKRLTCFAAVVFLLNGFGSCRKYLEIDLPKDQITSQAVFDNATNTLAAVNGL